MNQHELMPLGAYAKGVVVMLSLIVAIGPQNAVIIRQSLCRDRAFAVSAICLFGDMSMVAIGTLGLGAIISSIPTLHIMMNLIASIYMFVFAFESGRNALARSHMVLKPDSDDSVMLTAVIVTFLNPHAMMDTILIVGTIANEISMRTAKVLFVLGAISASAIWFFGLALVGHSLAGPLSRPRVWKIVDLSVAVMMCVVGAILLAHVFDAMVH